MSETTITQLPDPSGFSADPFTDVIRDGARKLIEQAINVELATLMAAFSGEKLEDGRAPPVSGMLSAALLFLYFSGGRDRMMIWDIHRNARRLC